jgi:enterobactin synthetase component D / holo-[acyl-carrier protein] synthase
MTFSVTGSISDVHLDWLEQCVPTAVPPRRREFALGRWCARRALCRLGIHDYPVQRGSANEPVWPPGIAGSISHCEGYCGAAVVRRKTVQGIGIDVELSEPLAQRLRRMVCRQSELEWIERSTPPPHSDWAKLMFSAKESVYKCVYPLLGTRLGFHDIEIRMIPSHHRFVATVPGHRGEAKNRDMLRGRYLCTASHIFTAAVSSSFAPCPVAPLNETPGMAGPRQRIGTRVARASQQEPFAA